MVLVEEFQEFFISRSFWNYRFFTEEKIREITKNVNTFSYTLDFKFPECNSSVSFIRFAIYCHQNQDQR